MAYKLGVLEIFLQEVLLDPPTLGMVCSHPGALTDFEEFVCISIYCVSALSLHIESTDSMMSLNIEISSGWKMFAV